MSIDFQSTDSFHTFVLLFFSPLSIFHKSSGESNNLLTNRGHFAEQKLLYVRIYGFMRALNYKALSFIYKVTDYTFIVLLWNCFFLA